LWTSDVGATGKGNGAAGGAKVRSYKFLLHQVVNIHEDMTP
jgi:hypothetical protein